MRECLREYLREFNYCARVFAGPFAGLFAGVPLVGFAILENNPTTKHTHTHLHTHTCTAAQARALEAHATSMLVRVPSDGTLGMTLDARSTGHSQQTRSPWWVVAVESLIARANERSMDAVNREHRNQQVLAIQGLEGPQRTHAAIEQLARSGLLASRTW